MCLTIGEMINIVSRNVRAREFVSNELKAVIESSAFWESVDKLIQAIEPLTDAITTLEGASSVSNVYHTWTNLEQTYKDIKIDPKLHTAIQQSLNRRWVLIQDDILYAAHALDPHYGSKCLDANVFDTADKVLAKVNLTTFDIKLYLVW